MAGLVISDNDDLRTETDGPVKLHQQEASKAYFRWSQYNTNMIDSFNISSMSDNSTGDYTANWTHSFASGSYPLVGGGNVWNGVDSGLGCMPRHDAHNASNVRCESRNMSATKVDFASNHAAAFGELA